MKRIVPYLAAFAITASCTPLYAMSPVVAGSVGTHCESRSKKERDYVGGVTHNEIKDIRFIVVTLANVAILKLPKHERQLNEAGNRIDHVHPLNFWRVIFSDKEMTSAMHSIKRRSVVWKRFIKGSSNSFEEERTRKNLQEEFIRDFTSQLNIDHSPVAAALNNREWKEFVELLLDLVPREDNPGRYDF